jgi:hypothetical protein
MDYRICGLTVRSEFPISHLPAVDAGTPAPEVTVRLCREVGEPDRPHFRSPGVVAGAQDFLFRPLPGLSFRVRNGDDIAIARASTVADNDVRIFLVGSVFGVLWHQRRLVPLHCSAVARGADVFAFTGSSGAGKSTLAAGLGRRGLAHVCDDVCVVDPAVRALPCHAVPKELKLRRDAIETFGLARGDRVSTLVEKFYVSPPSFASCEPRRFAALYVLRDSDAPTCDIVPLDGGARFEELLAAVYRNEWLVLLRNPAEAFEHIAAIARNVKLFRFSRPRDFSRFDQGAALLESHMADVATRE